MNEIDHEHTREIVCPHCGYEFSESYEFTADCGSIQCYECEKWFNYYRSVRVHYSTQKHDEERDEPEWC